MTDNDKQRVAAWARVKLADELVAARESSTTARRAYHEGVAAMLAYTGGEPDRALALLTTILVDYTGARNVSGREGVKAGAMMIRGVAHYLKTHDAATAEDVGDAWAADRAAADA